MINKKIDRILNFADRVVDSRVTGLEDNDSPNLKLMENLEYSGNVSIETLS